MDSCNFYYNFIYIYIYIYINYYYYYYYYYYCVCVIGGENKTDFTFILKFKLFKKKIYF